MGLELSGVGVNKVKTEVVQCVVGGGGVSSLRSLHARTVLGKIRFVTYRVSVSMVNIGHRRLLSRIAVNKITACVGHTRRTGMGLFVWVYVRGVGSVYIVERLFGTLSRLRAHLVRRCKISLGRTVTLYYVNKSALATDIVSRGANLSTSRASGIVHSVRRGRLVIHGLKSGSGQRVRFALSSGKHRYLRTLGTGRVRVPRLLGPLFGWALLFSVYLFQV